MKLTIKDLKEMDAMDNLAVSAEEGQILHDLVKKTKPKTLLEVGTGHGYSTAWIALAMKKGAKMTTVDRELCEMLDGDWANVEFTRGTLKEHILSLPKKIDFVFLDSDHQIQNITADVETLDSRLSKGSMVVVHDTVYCDEMGRCLSDYFGGKNTDRLKRVEVKPSKKSWKYKEMKTLYGLGIAVKG